MPDIHAEALELAEALAREGRQDAAGSIHLAIEGGATGTESLSRLSGALREIGRRRSVDRDTARRARSLRREINRTLRRI